MQTTVCIFVAFIAASISGSTGHALRHGRGAPAPAVAKPDGLDSLTVGFEINNYDYFGLSDEWSCPWDQDDQDKHDKKDKNKTKGAEDPKDLEVPSVAKAIDDMSGWWDKHISFLQDKVKCQPKSDSLQQLLGSVGSQASPTMMDALRITITNAIEGAIDCEKAALVAKAASPAAAPAASLAPAVAQKSSLLSTVLASSPAPAPAPEPTPAGPSIHVTFRPGSNRPTTSLLALTAEERQQKEPRMLNKPRASLLSIGVGVQAKSHWSVIVDVTITDYPKNGLNDLKESKKYLRTALVSGQLKDVLRNTMYQVVGNPPDIRHLDVKPTVIKQWDVKRCEKHLSNVVNMFTLHYTRAQVPLALYNECTNFMPKMSFSRDHILDGIDAHRCRKATVAFEKHWRYGAESNSKDFANICVEVCEAKYGDKAPLCHVSEGMELKSQPP